MTIQEKQKRKNLSKNIIVHDNYMLDDYYPWNIVKMPKSRFILYFFPSRYNIENSDKKQIY